MVQVIGLPRYPLIMMILSATASLNDLTVVPPLLL